MSEENSTIRKEHKLKFVFNKGLGLNSLKGILERELKQYGFRFEVEVIK